MKNFKKGFTLIELLVVVAIIGILASVVLASLNSARMKGADAAIKANITSARAQAELFYDGNSQSYLNVCTATGGIANMKSAATNAGSAVVDCNSIAGAWAMSGQLKTNSANYYCVDSTGIAMTTTVALSTATGCTASSLAACTSYSTGGSSTTAAQITACTSHGCTANPAAPSTTVGLTCSGTPTS
ncbi:MAG: type II secretion system protein [Candidatus Paceibacterota bacterium]